LLAPERIALTVKHVRPDRREPQLVAQLQEDVQYYRQKSGCATLIVFVYDPEGLLSDPPVLERAWSERQADLEVRCTIAVPGR
jgi:hypothetical protein